MTASRVQKCLVNAPPAKPRQVSNAHHTKYSSTAHPHASTNLEGGSLSQQRDLHSGAEHARQEVQEHLHERRW